MTSIPRALFYTSASQRVALARQTYFEEGIVPSGIVSGNIIESWARCRRYSFKPSDEVQFNQVSNSRTHLALQHSRDLVNAWQAELAEIEGTLSGTSCSAILTDATGVLIATTGKGDTQAKITPAAHRIGVNLSEEYAGTTAPGLVLKTGKSATVLGGEHFFEGVVPMHCAAAPIHNAKGRLAGVLDISSEGLPFEFDMTALVGLYATSIENRLLITQSNDHLVMRIQVSPTLLDTPMAGLVGINSSGQIDWMNGAASSLFGKNFRDLNEQKISAEDIFGVGTQTLLNFSMKGAVAIRLTNEGVQDFV